MTIVSGVDVTRTYRKRGPSFAFLLGDIPLPGPWVEQGACRGWPVEWWFPRRGLTYGTTARAREICAGCQVRMECTEFGLTHSRLLGLWGGLSEKERRMARRLRRAS
jgi:WhiB family transcriptional regulator, redox-sensing transcriptional regulator